VGVFVLVVGARLSGGWTNGTRRTWVRRIRSARDRYAEGATTMAPEKKSPGPSVKDDKTYEALRDEGASKEKAARIANAASNTSRSEVGKKGGASGSYDDWTKDELEQRAREIGIEGRSSMSKSELIDALRNH
jgi:hypothetical protein